MYIFNSQLTQLSQMCVLRIFKLNPLDAIPPVYCMSDILIKTNSL